MVRIKDLILPAAGASGVSYGRAAGLFANVLILMAVCALPLKAQQTQYVSLPYSCSFEVSESAETQEWTLNGAVTGLEEMWYIDSATYSDGGQALYVSDDGGLTTEFGLRKTVVVAYRKMVFHQGVYDFTFDWKCMAEKDNSGLYFCIVPESSGEPYSVAGSSTMPSWLQYNQRTVTTPGGNTKCLRGTDTWQSAVLQESLPEGFTAYIAFAWVNEHTDSVDNPLAACVDNLQITNANCGRPSNLTVESTCDTAWVSWSGRSPQYELQYREIGSPRWIKKSGITSTSYTITEIDEGVYDFKVRGICSDTMFSAWTTLNEQIVFCPDNHCINYIDLNDSHIKCYTGKAGGADDQFLPVGPIDHGAQSIESRHTVVFSRNAGDPRTNNKLKLVPEGELASIRLGNWMSGAEAERIEFEFTVDTSSAAVLLLKYAIVFQLPNHPKDEQPKFNLTLLDEYDNPLDKDCGYADFYALKDREGWNMEIFPGMDTVQWKDWTTMGINLAPYHGRTITIQITSQDCVPAAHYGYAYFALSCASGKIQSVSCGAEEDMDIEAPEGFDYVWCRGFDADSVPLDTLSKDRVFQVPVNDKSTYYCRCMFTENHDCFFDLRTEVSPRSPKADMRWTHVPENCENYMRFENVSHVTTLRDGQTVSTSEPLEALWWDFGDGEMVTGESPLMMFPPEGDTVQVTLMTSLLTCEDDTTVTVIVPSILTPVDTIDSVSCTGAYWGGKFRTESGLYVDSSLNVAGCDSVTYLDLTVVAPPEDTHLYPDPICFGDSLVYEGHVFKAPESKDEERVVLTSAYGCDSVVILHLTYNDEVTFLYAVKDVEGEPNSGEIAITSAPEGYTWSLDGETGAPLTGLSGGTYELVVYDSIGCPSAPVEVFINQDCIEVTLDADSPMTMCADDSVFSIPCSFGGGSPTTFEVKYGAKAVVAGFVDYSAAFADMNNTVEIRLPDSVRPDSYDAEIVVADIICDDVKLPITFDVMYPSSIIRQKWNNVLAVTNSHYNGGYDFTAFRWYKDGVPIPDADGSYLYLGEEEWLDTAGLYWVELTRADDEVTVASCPLIPELRAEGRPYPVMTVAAAAQRVKIRNVSRPVQAAIYDVTGLMLWSGTVDAATDEVRMPDRTGVYILLLGTGAESVPYKVLVR